MFPITIVGNLFLYREAVPEIAKAYSQSDCCLSRSLAQLPIRSQRPQNLQSSSLL